MPGITGVVGRGSIDDLESQADRMAGVMRHEKFYTSGRYSDERLGLALGWSVLGGTFADVNPIWNGPRDVCLVFAGEDFSNERHLLTRQVDSTKAGDHDSHYLLRLYEEEGSAFVKKLNGTLIGVVIDLRRNKAILFNDRFGLGRIYVHENEESVWFSSEAKSILKVCASTREIDPIGLAEYASCGCALQGRTLFRHVSLMPPASVWTIARGQVKRKETYFTADQWEHQPRLSETDFSSELQETFSRIAPKYFVGQQPIAMSLTGGLDGRMIMACDLRAPGQMPCYTFGGLYRECTDVVSARKIAAECDQSHQVIQVGAQFFPQFGPLAEKAVYVSDGAMDVTGAVELFVNRQAREIAPVRMTGNYGSEILRYNVAFKAQSSSTEFFRPEFAALVRKAMATYEAEATGHPMTWIAFKQVPWHHYSRLSVEQSQVSMRSPYLDNELVALAYRVPAGMECSKDPALRFIAMRKPGLGLIPTDRGLIYPPTPAITKLHNLYQEFTFRAEYAYDYGMPQWLARLDNSLSRLHLERIFLGRHKFYHFRVWYRDCLGDYLHDVLCSRRARERPHVNGGDLERLVTEHVSGSRNHTSALHQLLSIELIYRQLIERS